MFNIIASKQKVHFVCLSGLTSYFYKYSRRYPQSWQKVCLCYESNCMNRQSSRKIVTLFIRIYGIWEKKQWVFYTMMVVILVRKINSCMYPLFSNMKRQVAVLGIVYHTWQSLASAQGDQIDKVLKIGRGLTHKFTCQADILKDNPFYYAEARSCIIVSDKRSDLSLVIIHFLYEIGIGGRYFLSKCRTKHLYTAIIFLLNIRVLKYYRKQENSPEFLKILIFDMKDWTKYRAGSIMDVLHKDGSSFSVLSYAS